MIGESRRDLSSAKPRRPPRRSVSILSIEVTSIEKTKEVAGNGHKGLQQVEPPVVGLESSTEQLVGTYEQVLPAYKNPIESIHSNDWSSAPRRA